MRLPVSCLALLGLKNCGISPHMQGDCRFFNHLNRRHAIHRATPFWRNPTGVEIKWRDRGFSLLRGPVIFHPSFFRKFLSQNCHFFDFRHPRLRSVLPNPSRPGLVLTGSGFWLSCGFSRSRAGFVSSSLRKSMGPMKFEPICARVRQNEKCSLTGSTRCSTSKFIRTHIVLQGIFAFAA